MWLWGCEGSVLGRDEMDCLGCLCFESVLG